MTTPLKWKPFGEVRVPSSKELAACVIALIQIRPEAGFSFSFRLMPKSPAFALYGM